MSSRKAYIHSFITVAIMLIGFFTPAVGQIPEAGTTILGAFIGAIYGWCTVNMLWPSVLALVMFGLSGYMTVQGAFQAAASNPVILMILFLMAFSSILQSTGITQRIALWLISRPFVEGHPWILSLMILMAAWISSMFVGLTPPIIILWTILIDIAHETEIKKGNKWVAFMCFAVVVVSTLGTNAMPFQVGVVSTYGFMQAVTGDMFVVDYTKFLIFTLIMDVVMIGFLLIIGKFILRCDVDKLLSYKAKRDIIEPMSGAAKKALFLFALLVVALMLPYFLPQETALRVFLEKTLGSTVICILVTGLALFLREGDKPFVEFKNLVFNGVAWEVIFMLGCAFTISNALTSEELGIAPIMQDLVSPLLNNHSPFIFLAIVLLIDVIATNFVNNVVVAAVFVPLVSKIALTSGIINPVFFVAIFLLINDLGFVFPSSSVGGAMLHGQKDWLTKKDILSFGTVAILLTTIIVVAIGYPLGLLVF